MPEQKSIRDMLKDYGYNDGEPLTDKEFAELMVEEFKSFDYDTINIIHKGVYTHHTKIINDW